MTTNKLKDLILKANGTNKSKTVIKNAKIVDVYSGEIITGDIAIDDKYIVGIGTYSGETEIDACGKYVIPGLIDSHIHVESSYVSPEVLGELVVPFGTTTIIADPHEIVNVCGLSGLNYMTESAKNTKLDIKYMLPSCVPATPFENAGATILGADMVSPLENEDVIGLGEFMNFPGVINADDTCVDKIMTAKNACKFIDGHAPNVTGNALNAYTFPRILTDHECGTVAEMHEKITKGMYIMLRQGSACHDLRTLLKGVTPRNSHRLLLCSDDRQPKTILELGHINNHLKICVEEGLDPITAIQMATLNPAQCYNLSDRGAIAPGLLADFCIIEDLVDFNASLVFKNGEKVAENGIYLPKSEKYPIDSVKTQMNVANFDKSKLTLNLTHGNVNVIELIDGSVVTKKATTKVDFDENGNFIFNENQDICKISVIERHKNTGNVANALLKGYGIKHGAVALSIAHDSHNIIATGISDAEIEFAVNALIKQDGGVVLTKNFEVIESLEMPIAGIMSDKDASYVANKLTSLHNLAVHELKINDTVEPIMTLCFMSLPVIPELKLTDLGLFDVTKFEFIDIEKEIV